ncbi:UDP-N-acetylmuramoyl-L-alanine--D-glutamate ligase [Prochlorococcus marinus]|uniref:UDP-N-acetylmuramoylalanine--D-glutamate ligase n=1 Tax=Prochlorococcus marinus XMU1408 TaxID=2213228 RepID=A0A318R2B0_PROMR|nr:UDP-N-acetylmuramoyl-L-alanine--D-glutamate ligase [Prochlorococcus marinus]MBW3042542.1 UDP-N-acetylmuramoyl-L-alanine--D-glutamate ligase [Prochlorococcus marinus str. XMU1408]PYE01267.1 UDP-N-acetylmuramoyl-L-alanine--D-glutamate ligase [Prochlorococcus marinus XMU1408]
MSKQKQTNKIHIVLGLGTSGINAAKLLISEGKDVLVLENNSNKKLLDISNKLKSEGIEVILLGEPLHINHFTPWMDRISSIVVSPGINWENIALRKLRSKNIKMQGEVELAWERLNHIPSIGITGTNGKTTVTNMLHHILKLNGLNTDMGGNIGKALSQIALEIKHTNHQRLNWLVLELSSYQIEGSPKLCPNIGIWTTFSPDHLERHNDIDTYFKIKRSLLEKSSIRIYNSDDQYLLSRRKELPEGIWVGINKQSSYSHHPKFWIDQKGYIFENQKELFHISILKIPGKHNLQNLLLVTAAAREIGLDHLSIAKAINSFKAIPHRLEYLGKKYNLKFFNDSKATNFESSITGLKAVPYPTILLAGGKQKQGDSLSWVKQINKSTNGIVLFGVSATELKKTILKSSYKKEIIVRENLEDATKTAIDIAIKTKSKSILLSPACASFDQYQNYEERGIHFKKLVKKHGVIN